MVSSPPSPSRGRSRKAGRPALALGDGRAALLDAALRLFARQGIAATPLSGIAAEARVTPAMLHYYFGSRAQLLEAVVEERLQPLILGIASVLAEQPAPALGLLIERLVRKVVETVQTHPWLPALWVHEILSEGGLLREAMLTRFGGRLAPVLQQRLAAAQAAGQLNAALDPRLTVVSLIGLTLFPLASAPIWRRLFAADDLGPEQMVGHTLALLRRGLELKP